MQRVLRDWAICLAGNLDCGLDFVVLCIQKREGEWGGEEEGGEREEGEGVSMCMEGGVRV